MYDDTDDDRWRRYYDTWKTAYPDPVESDPNPECSNCGERLDIHDTATGEAVCLIGGTVYQEPGWP
jgi:hypothetical protein